MNTLLSEAFTLFLPNVLQIISAILGALLIQGAGIAKTRWGIQIEATHREALHSALMSGIRAALARGEDQQAAITSAIKHATESVPDAMFALKPTSTVLASIAEAKFREALAHGGSVVGEFMSSRTRD